MKRLACVLAIGCGTSSHLEVPVRDAATPHVADAAVATPPAPRPPPIATIQLWQPQLVAPPIVTAAPQAIAVIAATDDGELAVTSDGRTTLRLWPTLDGKREPVMLPATLNPARLAVIRDGTDLAIAAADRTGQLEVLRTSPLGELHLRTRIDLGQPITALVPAAGGFIVLRQDQTLVAVDPSGAAVAALTPEPGEHVAALSSRRGLVIAGTSGDHGARIRRLAIGPGLVFGETSPEQDIDPARIALAPSGTRFAAFSRNHKTFAIRDVATGAVVKVVFTFEGTPSAPFVRGFLDEDTLMWGSSEGRDLWWRKGKILDSSLGFFVAQAGMSDRQMLTGATGTLELFEPGRVRYLGYRQALVTSLAREGNGWVMTDGMPRVTHVDDRFRTKRTVDLDPGYDAAYGWSEVSVVDGSHVLARGQHGISELDLAHPEVAPTLIGDGMPHYQPATGVLLLEGQTLQGSVRDPKTGVFSTPCQVAEHAAVWRLLDPPGKGPAAVALTYTGDNTLRMVTARIGSTLGVPELDVDSDGPDHEIQSAVQLTPDQLARAGIPLPPVRHANRDHSLVAEVGDGRITLRDQAGKVRWSISHPGATDVAWSKLGDLVAFGGGLARIDLETGALADRQCGWSFGLLDERTAFVPAGAQLCEEP